MEAIFIFIIVMCGVIFSIKGYIHFSVESVYGKWTKAFNKHISRFKPVKLEDVINNIERFQISRQPSFEIYIPTKITVCADEIINIMSRKYIVHKKMYCGDYGYGLYLKFSIIIPDAPTYTESVETA